MKNFNIPIRKKNFQMEELKFRNQIVKVNSKLTVINDSKSTNPNSTDFSIKKLKKKNSILIIGGKKKGCTFNKLFIPNIIKRVMYLVMTIKVLLKRLISRMFLLMRI